MFYCQKVIGPLYLKIQKISSISMIKFISLIQISIKRFVPIYSKNNQSRKYPSHIKKLLKEKADLYKKVRQINHF